MKSSVAHMYVHDVYMCMYVCVCTTCTLCTMYCMYCMYYMLHVHVTVMRLACLEGSTQDTSLPVDRSMDQSSSTPCTPCTTCSMYTCTYTSTCMYTYMYIYIHVHTYVGFFKKGYSMKKRVISKKGLSLKSKLRF